MDALYDLLTKVYEKPGLIIGQKSLTILSHFLNGYYWGVADCKEIHPETTIMIMHDLWFEFEEFVYMYYGYKITSMSSTGIICKNTTSEEEAFDKYFELLNAFLKQKGYSFLD